MKWIPEETVCPFSWGAKETDPFKDYAGTSLAIKRSHASMRRMSSRNLEKNLQGARGSVTAKRSSILSHLMRSLAKTKKLGKNGNLI